MPPDPDAGALARILGLIGGGETRVVVELDGLRDRGDPVPDLEPSPAGAPAGGLKHEKFYRRVAKG